MALKSALQNLHEISKLPYCWEAEAFCWGSVEIHWLKWDLLRCRTEWLLFDFAFLEGWGFFLFKRHHRESTSLKHTAASSVLSLETIHAVVGPTGLSRLGEDGRHCWQWAPSCTYPCGEDYPLSLRLPADCCKTWRINCPSCPDPAFCKVLKDGRGGSAFSAFLLTGCSFWVSVLHFVCLLFWELVLSSGRVVTEQKQHSSFSCALLCLFSILLISVGICIASNMIITITLKFVLWSQVAVVEIFKYYKPEFGFLSDGYLLLWP